MLGLIQGPSRDAVEFHCIEGAQKIWRCRHMERSSRYRKQFPRQFLILQGLDVAQISGHYFPLTEREKTRNPPHRMTRPVLGLVALWCVEEGVPHFYGLILGRWGGSPVKKSQAGGHILGDHDEHRCMEITAWVLQHCFLSMTLQGTDEVSQRLPRDR